MEKLGFIIGIGIGAGLLWAPHLGYEGLVRVGEMFEIYLGNSAYFFAAVLLLYIWWSISLYRKLEAKNPNFEEVSSLCARLKSLPAAFVTIGMCFTISGLISAIQSFVEVVSSGGVNPLKALVNQGALVALASTALGLSGAWVLKFILELTAGTKIRRLQQKQQAFQDAQFNSHQFEALQELQEELRIQNHYLRRMMNKRGGAIRVPD